MRSLVAGAALAATCLVAGCGDSGFKAASGPYATPVPTPPVRVLNSACAGNTRPAPGDLTFVRNAITRQATQLQRVSDDLSGAVPGGNLAVDAGLARQNADGVAAGIPASSLCQPLRDELTKRARALADADAALVAAVASSGDVAGALQKAQAAYRDLGEAVASAGG